MPELLVLVGFASEPPSGWSPSLGEGRDGEGFLGGSLWTGLGEGEAGLGLIHFADEASGNEHLRRRVEMPDLPNELPRTPLQVRHLMVRSHHGRSLEGSPVGGYLTALSTLAPPGYGDDTGCAVDETLEGIEMLEGYAGHLRGVNAALPDEVWALVFWSAPPLLSAPPSAAETTIAHYRRVR